MIDLYTDWANSRELRAYYVMQNQALFGFFLFTIFLFRNLAIIEMSIMVRFIPGTEECTPILIHVLDVFPKLYMYFISSYVNKVT